MRTAQNKPREETIESSAGSQKHTAKATRHQDAKASEQIGHRRHALHEFTPDRSAPLVTTHRTHGMYSEAAEYSPHQFAANSSDEYPSVSTYANTRTVSSAVSRAPVAADSTDWVNHVAQRRVTEVPDRFAK
ncbi:hypothetical protein F3J17_32125 [Burkholderia sp. Ax-1719]|nr:hypothetical protein [Burkholderia sp. Ax-1719]